MGKGSASACVLWACVEGVNLKRVLLLLLVIMREYRQATVSKIHRYSNTVYIYHFIFQFKCEKLGYLNSGELRQIQQGDNTFLSSYLCVSKCSAYFHLTYLPGLIDNWVNYGNISVSDICIVFNMWCIQQEHYFHAETEHWWINQLLISLTLDFTPSSLASFFLTHSYMLSRRT